MARTAVPGSADTSLLDKIFSYKLEDFRFVILNGAKRSEESQ